MFSSTNKNTVSRDRRNAINSGMEVSFRAFVIDEDEFGAELLEIKRKRGELELKIGQMNKNIKAAKRNLNRRGSISTPVQAWENKRAVLIEELKKIERTQQTHKDKRNRLNAEKTKQLSRGGLLFAHIFIEVAKATLPPSAFDRVKEAAWAEYSMQKEQIKREIGSSQN